MGDNLTNNNTFNIHNYYVGNNEGPITFGYTKRHGGLSNYPKDSFNMALYIGDDANNVYAHQEKLAKEIGFPTTSWIFPIQKHGGNIARVSMSDKGTNVKILTDEYYNVDGLYTYDTGILLTMNYADCIPIYVYSKINNFIGLAHAGWRGTAEHITTKLIECYDGNKEDLQVIIGVGINQSHYEVNDTVIDALHPLPTTAYERTETGFQLDLKEVNKHQAIDAGINKSNIHVTDFGTEADEFFSFRLEAGNSGRALAFIGRNSND